MKQQNTSENYKLKVEDGMDAVLDSVLEDIDTILIDNIPNPAGAFPPLPSIPQNDESKKPESRDSHPPHAQYQYEDDISTTHPPQPTHPMQSYIQHSLHTTNHNNNNNNNTNMVMMNSNNNVQFGYDRFHHQNMQNMYPNTTENTISSYSIQQRIMNSNCAYNNINKSFTPSSSYNSLTSLDTVKSRSTSGSINTNNETSNNTQNNIIFQSEYDKLNITSFTYNISQKLQIKDCVFISKDCTQRLSEYIVKEEWGNAQGLLYKYTDYIFRCQAFKQETIIINNKYLIFHSGLQRRNDKQFLYALLIPNKKYMAQKWRVQFGNIKNSFLSKTELLSKLPKASLIEDYLPKRTVFYTCLSDLLYDDAYSIEVNWEERLSTNKDRIHRVLGNVAFFDSKSKFMKLSGLIEVFKSALHRSKQIAELNPRLAVGQAFIDKKKRDFRIELLLPLIVEFPKRSSNYYRFALALHKSTEGARKYIGKSILTTEMAYSNARLVGYVDSNWLFYSRYNHKPKDLNDFFCKN